MLLVEDDAGVSACLVRALARQVDVIAAATLREASEFLRRPNRLRAAMIDIALPDGDGFVLLEEIRRSRRDLPVTLLSGHLSPQHVNRAFALRAHYLVKPLNGDELQRLREWIAESAGPATNPATLAARFALTPRESELLVLSLEGLRRDVIRARLGVRESTIKKTVSRLLRKFEVGSLREIAELIESERHALLDRS